MTLAGSLQLAQEERSGLHFDYLPKDADLLAELHLSTATRHNHRAPIATHLGQQIEPTQNRTEYRLNPDAVHGLSPQIADATAPCREFFSSCEFGAQSVQPLHPLTVFEAREPKGKVQQKPANDRNVNQGHHKPRKSSSGNLPNTAKARYHTQPPSKIIPSCVHNNQFASHNDKACRHSKWKKQSAKEKKPT